MVSLDTDIIIIGAGPSGLGLAIRAQQDYGSSVRYELYEKGSDVGGTWQQNTYPGCGCDVASHFYSFSFALKPDWTQKFSMQPEIQAYFRDVAEKSHVYEHVRLRTEVMHAEWKDFNGGHWQVTVRNLETGQQTVRRSKVLVSAVGGLSVPKPFEMAGKEAFEGPIFHSSQWDHGFDWHDKNVVVIGNGCSATQFVPVMSDSRERKCVRKITQFSQSAHYLAERPNPTYSETFKAIMRHVPLAMRLYRVREYAMMERDFAGFNIAKGQNIRRDLTVLNEQYLKSMAPEKYWDALLPRHMIGCKRKVMDTDYLASLWRDNVELVANDPVAEIVPDGVKTRSGRIINADAIVLAIGFATGQMLFPMEIIGNNGVSLNEHVSEPLKGLVVSASWDRTTQGAAQAYLGTCVSGFRNFFILMGPNTVTGHLSVIYTVECQINFVMRLIKPIMRLLHPNTSWLPWNWSWSRCSADSVEVKLQAAQAETTWTQTEAKKLVWSSGCSNWYLHPDSDYNIMMYPDWQFKFWLRSIFIPFQDFTYWHAESSSVIPRMSLLGKVTTAAIFSGSLLGVFGVLQRHRAISTKDWAGALTNLVHVSAATLRQYLKVL